MDECYLAVKFDDEDQPQFGQLSGIFEVNLHMVVFDVIFLETIGFDPLLFSKLTERVSKLQWNCH